MSFYSVTIQGARLSEPPYAVATTVALTGHDEPAILLSQDNRRPNALPAKLVVTPSQLAEIVEAANFLLAGQSAPLPPEFGCMIFHEGETMPALGGVGPTESKESAKSDVAAWIKDGYDARLVRRAVNGWEQVQ